MKKLILSGLLLASTFFVQAQTKTDSVAVKKAISTEPNGDNEIKLNLLMSIAGLPEITYERIIAEDQSAGLAILFGIDGENDYNFGVIPYYRIYFGGKKASGFFIEGNTAVITSNYEESNYTNSSTGYGTYSSVSKTQTNFGLGAAAGAKFLTKSGFIGEAYFGLGRLFGAHGFLSDIYPRLGITIGKRF